jgi:hypothetical protein
MERIRKGQVVKKDQGFGQRKRPAVAEPPQKKRGERARIGQKTSKTSIVRDSGPNSFWAAIKALLSR